MARKKVIDLDTDQVLKFEKKGQVFEGYYLGAKAVTSDYGKALIHCFQNDEGVQGLWGSRKLDEKLGTIAPGTMTFITYLGKVKIPGGKTMHKFEVEYDDEITIDLGGFEVNVNTGADDEEDDATPAGASAASDEEVIDEEAAAEEDDATEGQDEEEATKPAVKTKPAKPAPPAPPTKASADKVSNMLSKRR